MREALTARGVDPGTVRLAIKKDSRTVSVRYNSAYHPDSAVYRAQTLLIALAVSRVALRVEPPLEGGVQVSIIPELDDEIGLKVILIDWTSLTAWAEGMLSEEGFVAAWAVGSIPRE